MQKVIEDIHSTGVAGIHDHIWIVRYLWDFGDGPILHGHAFPMETLDWRAAEYDIDPADTHTLLHIILYEPWEDGIDPMSEVQPTHYLYTSTTKSEARAEKFKRTKYDTLHKKAAKGKRITDHDLLKPIHERGLYHPAGLDDKKTHIEQVRHRVHLDMRRKLTATEDAVPPSAWMPNVVPSSVRANLPPVSPDYFPGEATTG